MPPLNTSVRSYLEYRKLFYGYLTAAGFNPKGDIAIKDLDLITRAQIVLAGNDFFFACNLQISFPRHTREIEKSHLQNGARLHSQDIYHPLLLLDAVKLAPLRTCEYLSSAPNWSQAGGDIDNLVEQISCAYTDYMDNGVYKDSPWWPSSLTEIQKKILTTVLENDKPSKFRLSVLCELLS